MEIATLFFIAIGLSMDSLAVSFASGICLGKVKFKDALSIAITFGVFHFIMPYVGYYAGYSFHDLVKEWDHWIAFVLLAFLGIKMIVEGIQRQDDKACFDPTKLRTRLTLALGTSIDALAVGISMAFLDMNAGISCLIFGGTAAVISLLGVYSGSALNFKKLRVEIIGGVILILIGVRILVDHLVNNI